jgi:hypothetical protein
VIRSEHVLPKFRTFGDVVQETVQIKMLVYLHTCHCTHCSVSALAIHRDKLYHMCDICERDDCAQSHPLACGPFMIFSSNCIHIDGRC